MGYAACAHIEMDGYTQLWHFRGEEIRAEVPTYRCEPIDFLNGRLCARIEVVRQYEVKA
jgi:hypothetical protein